MPFGLSVMLLLFVSSVDGVVHPSVVLSSAKNIPLKFEEAVSYGLIFYPNPLLLKFS